MPRPLTQTEFEKHGLANITCAESAEFAWLEAAEGEATKLKKFTITAYTGAPMRVGFGWPVVVDLAGMDVAGEQMPILKDHDPTQIVGHTDSVDKSVKRLKLTGVVSGVGEASQEVIALGANGFPWQASIGASIEQMEFVDKGESVNVNGRAITGPVYVARKSTLRETSFVAIGADAGTSGRIAAQPTERKITMDSELKAYIESLSFDPTTLSEAQVTGLRAAFEKSKIKPKEDVKLSPDAQLASILAEANRKEEINNLFFAAAADRTTSEITELQKLRDGAIEAKWDVRQFQLAMLQASRTGVAIHIGGKDKVDGKTRAQILTAAICKTGRLASLEKDFTDQVLQAAHDRYRNGIGLNELIMECAQANGYRGSISRVNIDAQRAAFGLTTPTQIQAQGWSTVEISSIISNVANKFLRQGWNSVDMTPMRIASIRAVRDFKTITTVSLTGNTEFEKLGAAGEIKHGTLGEVVYTNKADTYAKMLAITRQDIVNDDTGALTDAPMKLGQGGGDKLNDIFWTAFLYGETSGFFSATHTTAGNTGNSNLNSTYADMTVAGLSTTEEMFMSQVKPNGKPLGVEPGILLVPTALKAAALTLMNSEYLIDGTATAKQGSTNIFRGRWRVESSPYMHNATYTGYSASKWYLMADPSKLPTIEIVALNGQVEPTVDSADADFNTLGIQMRGYSDVGVSLQEFRACVKADGGSS